MKKLLFILFLLFYTNIFANEQNNGELYLVVEQKIKEYSFDNTKNLKKEKICIFNSKNQLIYFCNDKSDFPVEYKRRVDFIGKIGNTEYYMIFN
jgi:hypothetical protein